MDGWDLELLPLLVRCLLGLVMWYGRLVVTFGGFTYSKYFLKVFLATLKMGTVEIETGTIINATLHSQQNTLQKSRPVYTG